MIVGIDGNMWYCSNGACLAESRAEFTFQPTLREAYDEYREKFDSRATLPKGLAKYLDMATDEAQSAGFVVVPRSPQESSTMLEEKHDWECRSPGEYDFLYVCTRCGAKNIEQADNPTETRNPEHGCIPHSPQEGEQ